MNQRGATAVCTEACEGVGRDELLEYASHIFGEGRTPPFGSEEESLVRALFCGRGIDGNHRSACGHRFVNARTSCVAHKEVCAFEVRRNGLHVAEGFAANERAIEFTLSELAEVGIEAAKDVHAHVDDAGERANHRAKFVRRESSSSHEHAMRGVVVASDAI